MNGENINLFVVLNSRSYKVLFLKKVENTDLMKLCILTS